MCALFSATIYLALRDSFSVMCIFGPFTLFFCTVASDRRPASENVQYYKNTLLFLVRRVLSWKISREKMLSKNLVNKKFPSGLKIGTVYWWRITYVCLFFTYFSSKVKIEVKTTVLTQCGPLIITKPRFSLPKLFGPTHMSTSTSTAIIAYYFTRYLFKN